MAGISWKGLSCFKEINYSYIHGVIGSIVFTISSPDIRWKYNVMEVILKIQNVLPSKELNRDFLNFTDWRRSKRNYSKRKSFTE